VRLLQGKSGLTVREITGIVRWENPAFDPSDNPSGCEAPIKATFRRGPGFDYPAVVLDAFSHRIVGWAISQRIELVLQALNSLGSPGLVR
jgi:transposase InsO family protein